MALVLLPGLSNLIDDISEEKKLPPQVVEAALREALLKGYERYRRTLYIGISEDPFDEEYFSNFDVGLDLEQGLPKGRLHHLGRQLLLFADVVDQVAEAGKQDESHRVGLGEKKGAVAGV